MTIECPHCSGVCESDGEIPIGAHVKCPFCAKKFHYGESADSSDMNSADVKESCQAETSHEGTKYCGCCGTKIPATASFCHRCGRKVLSEDAEVSDTNENKDLTMLHAAFGVKCPYCGTEYEVDECNEGDTCQCSVCNKDFTIHKVQVVECAEERGKKTTDQMESRFCTYCGASISETAFFCGKCGKKAVGRGDDDVGAMGKTIPATIVAKIKKIALWRISTISKVVACGAVLLVIGAVFVFKGKGPQHGDMKNLILPGGATMEMIYIGPGEFFMGSDHGDSDEKPLHRVHLTKGFWLGKYEVTQKQWQSVMGDNPSAFKGEDRPVESVSWDDCQYFIQKVNDAARQQLGGEARLPTEAEWEYACRAGSTTAYFWGNSLNGDKANCAGNIPCGTTAKGQYKQQTTPVGSCQANAWGFYGMHGNVYEWCQDRYDSNYYSRSPAYNPCNTTSGVSRVLRGGRNCRSADRDWWSPSDRYCDWGFRFCCSARALD